MLPLLKHFVFVVLHFVKQKGLQQAHQTIDVTQGDTVGAGSRFIKVSQNQAAAFCNATVLQPVEHIHT